jgi:hypothetical protein
MADLFKRTEVDFGGAMTSEKGMLVPNKGLTGLLMQNFTLQYQQNVTRIYEIGTAGETAKVYYISGRSAGTLSSSHIVGPGVSLKEFYDNFSDVCEAGTNDIQIQLGPNICEGANNIAYNAKFCVLVSIGVSLSAQEFVINENSALMFSGLEYTS